MPRVNAPKYSDAQRAAVAHAVLDRGLPPAAVQRLAQAGELDWQGHPLPAFTMPTPSIGTYAHREKQRRAARDTGEIAKQPPRDAVEVLRRRLVQVADRETRALTRKKAGTVNPEQLRQLARAVREISAIPGPNDPRPAAPGAKVNGEQNGGQTRGGAVGALLADHRAEHGRGTPRVNAPEGTPAPTPHPAQRESGDTGTHAAEDGAASSVYTADGAQDHASPGSIVSAFAADVGATG